VATKLVQAAEDWFRMKEIAVVELSYMVKNELAAISWNKPGYQPFSVFAYKELHDRKTHSRVVSVRYVGL
jgi:hypothetical protein